MVTRRTVLKSGAALGLFTMAGCAPQGTKASSAPTTPVNSIDVAKAGAVTLSMLDWWSGDAAQWVANAVKAYQQKYPNVTIKRTSVDWGQLTQTANLRLKEKTPPDIITVNNGWQSLGTLAKAGLVMNLDGYSKSFGWDKFPSTILCQTQFTPDGKSMGTGSLFATPVASSSLIGLYYNKTVLQKAGATAPTDLASFEDACTKAKAAGLIPIGYGSQDKGSSTAILLALQDMFGDQQKINDFVYSTGAVKAADIGMTEAAERLKSYQDKGWLTPNHAGIQYADAVDAFLKGKSAFRFEYTGTFAFKGAQKQDYGYVQLPQVNNQKVVGTGASTAVALGSKCAHPDVAASFLDFLAGQQTAQYVVQNGLLPLLHDVQAPADNPEFGTEIAGQRSLDKDNGYVPYFDWSTPSMLDTLGGQVQLLLAGRTAPDGLVKAVQADYDKFQAGR
ncbi:ABC transporter substrate-binding protein [Kribbella kalugense]|uniref:Carbohydrate ABC transporter substrate-binding protein (CUT1 family) n=1 Tax=Kribbella kalugense TaxID=2512221 RepID=A0A4V3G821_9ACTN|nr:extracellular solute-binding protein [Kribbella kalugense]TDW21234.1 carbohydrate ABC transporter substrate-binding protein (CUT1 family) [Kribbella kalugense]